MITPTTISVFGSALGNILGFAAKQPFILKGMAAVKEELERCVSSVVLRNPHSPLAPVEKTVEALTIPITCVIGDVVWTCVAHATLSLAMLIGRVTGVVADKFQNSFASRTVIGVVSSTLGYIWKYVMAVWAQPITKIALERLCLVSAALFPASLIAYAPAITIIVADITGFILTEAIYHISLRFFSKKE
jgi:hypothetical protein